MHFGSVAIADGEPGRRAKYHHATQPGDNNSERLRIESGIFQSHQSMRICLTRSLIHFVRQHKDEPLIVIQ